MSANTGSLIELTPRYQTVHLSAGRTVLATSQEGWIAPESEEEGLFVYQTRTLCRYRWRIEGQTPKLSTQSNLEQWSWMGYYIQAPPNCKATPAGECDPLQETIELRLTRSAGEGFHEDVDLTNHTQVGTAVRVELELGVDFLARDEIKERKQQGRLKEEWRAAGAGAWELDFDYQAEHAYDEQGNRGTARLHRGLFLRIERAGSEPRYAENKLRFDVVLPPHGQWHTCLSWFARVDGRALPLAATCNAAAAAEAGGAERRRNAFLQSAAAARVPGQDSLAPLAGRVLDRSRRDLAALRLFDLDGDAQSSGVGYDQQGQWTIAAGVPTYVALFGRDTLTTAWQAAMLTPALGAGALDALRRIRAVEENDWRDAQPGRFLHEAQTDPLSALNYKPTGLYFGSYTTSVLYSLGLCEWWRWTGDLERARALAAPALEGLAWADRYSRAASGFYKYQKRSEKGVKNQGWKDSDDAIVHSDGSQVEDPLGTCEMQAYAYGAKYQLSALLWWLGQEESARRLFAEAKELRQQFNQTFWMDDQDWLGLGVDAQDQLIRSVGSDAAHCLVTGIVDEERAPRLAARMLRPDLFSGWGVRTLSADHPAFNPFSYHRGSVWPVENGYIALGLARYGLRQPLERIARAIFEAAALFPHDRLPEVFGGHPRDQQHPFPGLYTRQDWPQAWSAAAPFAIIRALLGLYPFAPLETLFVDPELPDWLPELTVERLRVGQAMVSLRFQRGGDGRTRFEILERAGSLHVLHHPRPWQLTAGWAADARQAMRDLIAAG